MPFYQEDLFPPTGGRALLHAQSSLKGFHKLTHNRNIWPILPNHTNCPWQHHLLSTMSRNRLDLLRWYVRRIEIGEGD